MQCSCSPDIPALCQWEGNIYNLLRTEHSRPLELPRSQSAASPYPFHYRHNNNMHWAQAKMILFGLSLSLSCPEWLMRQNESLTLHLGLILGLTGAGRKCQNVDTRLGIDVNFLPRIPTHVFRYVVGGGTWAGWSPCCHACAGAKLPLQLSKE